jgi:heme/copper-type cytochrome/quinol oxidase subunit 2
MTQPLREIVFWAAAAACVVAESAIVLSGLRVSGSRSRKGGAFLETVWAVLPAIALAWVLAATWGEMHRMSGHEHMNMPARSSNG